MADDEQDHGFVRCKKCHNLPGLKERKRGRGWRATRSWQFQCSNRRCLYHRPLEWHALPGYAKIAWNEDHARESTP